MSVFLSVVSPVYKAEKIISTLVERIENSINKITTDYEIILIEDCSPDNSWQEIEKICALNTKVVGIKLSKNFGQHNAITAGIENAKGEWVVVMDCDLQDLPEEIEKLYFKAQEGYDIVLARRAYRKDNFIKKLTSKLFYSLFSYFTDTKQDSAVANFGIYKREVIEAIKSMKDYYRVFPILVQWVGFNKFYLDVEHSSRFEGKSTYTSIKLLRLAFDMVISFSEKPLRLGLKVGLIISSSSFLFSIYLLIRYLLGYILVPGYASLSVLITFSTGIIITFIGLLGTYVGKISLQVKQRPNYIIKTKRN
jgi:dolichol-phosphate mannosyltransferase